jgi:predicted Zn finger-like uncharacterized protein
MVAAVPSRAYDHPLQSWPKPLAAFIWERSEDSPAMPVSITCPECDNSFQVKDDLVGRRIRCPKCSAVLTVPDEDEALSRRSLREEETLPRRPRGRPRRRPAGSRRLLLVLGVGGAILIPLVTAAVVGVIFFLRPSTNLGSDLRLPGLSAVLDNPRVTEDNFDRVKEDMTREQAEAILGPGEQIPRTEIYPILKKPTPAKVTTRSTVVKWKNGSDTILLEWSASGTLVWSAYVRDAGNGLPPRSRPLGFPKLE